MDKRLTTSGERRSALLVVTLSSFATPFITSAVTIALPSIGQEFKIDAILLSWIATSYLLAAAVVLIPFGRIADIVGRKRIFTYGISLFTISSLLSGLAPSPLFLIICRVFQGAGGAMVFATGIAILISVYPAEERGRVIGIIITATYIALAMGPLLGGFLTKTFGWRSIFLVSVPLGAVTTGIAVWKLKGERAEAKGESLDISGSIIYGFTLIAIIYGLSRLPERIGFLLILFGGIGLIIFLRLQENSRHPLLNMKLFKNNRLFALSNLAALIMYSATFATSFLLSLYLQYIKGFGPHTAGLIFLSRRLIQAAFSSSAGRLSDRIEPRIIASAGMALSIIGLILLITLNQETSPMFIIITLGLLGLSFALFSSPNTNAIMGSVERHSYGVAAAMNGTMRLIGQMLSMGIAMVVIATVIGKIQITPPVYPVFLKAMRITLIVFAILCSSGLWVSLTRGKLR